MFSPYLGYSYTSLLLCLPHFAGRRNTGYNYHLDSEYCFQYNYYHENNQKEQHGTIRY